MDERKLELDLPPIPGAATVGRDKPDFGDAVVDGRLLYTSVSTIQGFDVAGTEGACKRKIYFEKVLGRKPPEKKSQEIGKKVHADIERYEKTGLDELGPIARAGKHLLVRPGPDLHVEEGFATEEASKLAIAIRKAGGDPSEIATLAGLSAAGVPLVGYIDLWHLRGEYIDERGILCREDPAHVVAACDDHKTSKNIGRYAKRADDLPKTVQMSGYGEFLRRKISGLTHVRFSHNNFQTEGAKTATKVTKLVLVDDNRRAWSRVEGIVPEMEWAVARGSVEDLPANLDACNAFGGCFHALNGWCRRPDRTVLDLFQLKGVPPMSSTGLFAPPSIPPLPSNGVAHGAPPIPPLPPTADREAQLAAERAALAAEDAAALAVATPAALKVPCGAPGCGVNCVPGYVYNGRGYVTCAGCNGAGKIASAAPPPIPAIPSPVGGHVLPPDAPLPTVLNSADPLPPDVVAAIEDPELKARAEATAVAHRVEAERLAAEEAARKAAAGTQKTSGRCPGSGLRVQLTNEQAAKKKFVCGTCGKENSIKPSSDFKEATIPMHNFPKAAAGEPPPIPTVPNTPPAIPPVVATHSVIPVVPPVIPTPPQVPDLSTAPGALPGQTALALPPPPPFVPPVPSAPITEMQAAADRDQAIFHKLAEAEQMSVRLASLLAEISLMLSGSV